MGDSGGPLIKKHGDKNYIMGLHHNSLVNGLNSVLESFWVNLTNDSTVEWIRSSEEDVESIRAYWSAFKAKTNTKKDKLFKKVQSASDFSDFFILKGASDDAEYIKAVKLYLNKKMKFYMKFKPSNEEMIMFFNKYLKDLNDNSLIDFFASEDLKFTTYDQWSDFNLVIKSISKRKSLNDIVNDLKRAQDENILKINLNIYERAYLLNESVNKKAQFKAMIDSFLVTIDYEHEFIFLLETLYDIQKKDQIKIPDEALKSVVLFINDSYKDLSKDFSPDSCSIAIGVFFKLKKIQKALFGRLVL